jgi:glycosyltransferase involved in cell wall biosynthesis
MKIAILLDELYPFGMAATNRIHLYAKGYVELGNDVEIIIPVITAKPEKIRNIQLAGEYDGVKFKYACHPVRSNSFIGRRIQNIVSLFNSFIFIIRFKPKIILVVANNFKYVSLISNAKIVREKSEVPFYMLEEITEIKRIRTKTEFKMFDGIIVISGALKDFFSKDLSLHTKLLEVPILIDSYKASSDKTELKAIKPNLVYTGSLCNDKDGVFILIKAYARIIKEHQDVRLIMTGDLDESPDKEKILTLIDALNIKGKVELPGYVSKEKLHELTSTASALLLAKPESRQNRYNVATKIGEYLLTGRPVIMSSVDPICRYLSHRENAFIVEPDEYQVAQEIEFILDNSKKADLVGLAGKEIALRLFDYKSHALRMNNFFKEL